MRAAKSIARATVQVALGWIACVSAGCGPHVAPTGELSGKVTVKGKPVTAGMVKFFPEAGGEPVVTPLGTDGTYRVTGVPIGRTKVAIETLSFRNMAGPPPAIAKQYGGPKPVYVPIPEKYETPEKSGLAIEVEKGKKPWDIELQ